MSKLPASPAPVVVLGAGISGLAAAHRLLQRGREVLVLDRRSAPGGRIQSERREGFLVDYGPTSMVSPAPGVEALIDGLGLGAERLYKGQGVRHRYLVRSGQARALPIDPIGFFTSDFFSLHGRLRLLLEPLIPRRVEDESVAGFVRRRFGRELLEYVFDPLVGGLYAGDPEQLSITALLPRLKGLEVRYRSVVLGAAVKTLTGRQEARFDPRQRNLFSFRTGMAGLPNGLAAALGSRLRCGIRVEGLQPLPGGGFRLRLMEGEKASSLTAAALVIALPAYATARILEGISPALAHDLAGVHHPPLAVAALGYPRAAIDHPLDGLGLLTPSVEKRNLLGLLFSSTLFEGRAPTDHALLTAYLGGARQPDRALLPREELLALVREEAEQLLGARGTPCFQGLRYWPRGLPQPGLGHERIVQALRGLEQEFPGIAITGNYLTGVATTACIDAARTQADRIAEMASQSAANGRIDRVGVMDIPH